MAPIIMGGTDMITQPAQAAKLSILAWCAKKSTVFGETIKSVRNLYQTRAHAESKPAMVCRQR